METFNVKSVNEKGRKEEREREFEGEMVNRRRRAWTR